jgi:hypothetical protein
VQGMKVESCTQQDVEIRVRQAFLVSAAKPQLPLQVEDAARREDANQVKLLFNYCTPMEAGNFFQFSLKVFLFIKAGY